MVTVALASVTVTIIQFSLHEADDFMQHTQSVYIIVVSIMVAMYFFVMVFNMKDLFEFIANIENRIDGKAGVQLDQQIMKIHLILSWSNEYSRAGRSNYQSHFLPN